MAYLHVPEAEAILAGSTDSTRSSASTDLSPYSADMMIVYQPMSLSSRNCRVRLRWVFWEHSSPVSCAFTRSLHSRDPSLRDDVSLLCYTSKIKSNRRRGLLRTPLMWARDTRGTHRCTTVRHDQEHTTPHRYTLSPHTHTPTHGQAHTYKHTVYRPRWH